MHLKRLELKGFKSFPTKTEIDFNKGITAIVGPNGSGKSNISDAVRWVLGEQSIKSLRGDKLEDVIFGGSVNQKPMNYCEVALTIDNSDQKLNIEFSEVTIKRRAYRNGESGFFLNGKACRLKDIKELLLDTGIGKDGYSIIEQGKVDEILSNNPVNRRKVFDEACGISKYRYKKLEAEKNLKNTKENLERIEDVYLEIENRIKPLFAQQKKAIKYLDLREKLKKIEVNNYIREIKKVDLELESIDKQKKEILNELNEEIKVKEEMENKLLSTNQELKEIEDSTEKLISYIDSIKSVINQNESNLSLINERINNSNFNIKNNQKTLEDFSIRLEENNKKLADLQSQHQVKKLERDSLTEDIEKIELENLKNKNELDDINNKIDILKDNIIKYLGEKQNISNNLSMLNANTENINFRNEDVENNISRIDNLLENKNILLEDKKKILSSKQNDLQEINHNYSNLKNDLQIKIEENKNIDLNIQNNNYTQREYSSKLQIYTEMEKHYEGFNRGVKEVLKNKNLQGIHGALGQVVNVDQKYEKAIEAALGAYMQNIITADEYSAKNAINYLKKNNLGRVTFLPINIIKSKKINENSIKAKTKYINIASDLLEYDEKYRDILENILGRTIVIDNIDNAIKFANETSYKYKIVTLEGDIINPGGSLTGGSLKSNTNILSRKRLIKDYEEKIETLKSENIKNEEKRVSIKNLIYNIKNNIVNIEKDINTLEKDIIVKNAELNSINLEITSLVESKEKYKKEREGLNSNLDYTVDKIEKLKKELSNIEKKELENKEQINSLSQKQNTQAILFDHIKKKNENLRLDFVRRNEEFKSLESDIDRTKNDIKYVKEKISESLMSIEKLEAEIKDLQNESKLQTIENDNLSKQLKSKNNELDNHKAIKVNLKDIINDLNKTIKSYDRKHMDLKQSEFKIDSKIERLSTNKENYILRLFEDYDLTYIKALEIQDDSIEINKKSLDSLKKEIDSLGNINIDSIKEYEQTKERYDFYSEQKSDLEQSISAIESIISDLEKNMKVQFKEQFDKVNENFKYVYKRLFGGGEGSLTIVDENDILESDIEITAKPPGKKMKNLNLLSGGEKALTAISILFAIILAKPTPFCILDEIEAPLDDANIFRFGEYLKELSKDTQFIAVTHRRGTMEAANFIYGVTMEKKAISKVIGLNLNDAHKIVDIV